ncbi:MAG: 2,3-bisphosphoglycerate-dependent phosphoglycerate mutase [Halobacteriovoraceae bacterium]|nr:2,3-bisphosphoglycerate-dependent phosphoglycerate mutase [Halobacteriovoraceae bacterium]
MYLVLIRHGQSVWNRQNLFTGWEDVELSEQGVKEAKEAAKFLKKEKLKFDLAYSSILKRAIKTAEIITRELDFKKQIIKHWRLNERHYGALQGKNKKEVAEIHGDEQVRIWRRSYDTPPPFSDQASNKTAKKEIPVILGESLADTLKRVVTYWEEEILPQLKQSNNILIVAHGNSLRALIKYLFQIDKEKIIEFEIPTGKPILCEFDNGFNAIKYRYLK